MGQFYCKLRDKNFIYYLRQVVYIYHPAVNTFSRKDSGFIFIFKELLSLKLGTDMSDKTSDQVTCDPEYEHEQVLILNHM